VAHGTLGDLADRIEAAGYPVEWVRFPSGNVAIYVTDPDGHVVEFTELVVRWDGRPDTRQV
jgi:hypothetical protein